jgi:hypothetical protein
VPSPCVNGVCHTTSNGSAVCTCDPGYIGDHCNNRKYQWWFYLKGLLRHRVWFKIPTPPQCASLTPRRWTSRFSSFVNCLWCPFFINVLVLYSYEFCFSFLCFLSGADPAVKRGTGDTTHPAPILIDTLSNPWCTLEPGSKPQRQIGLSLTFPTLALFLLLIVCGVYFEIYYFITHYCSVFLSTCWLCREACYLDEAIPEMHSSLLDESRSLQHFFIRL